MNADRITITAFRGVTDNTAGKPVMLASFSDLAARLTKFTPQAIKKEITGWSPATFAPTCTCGDEVCPGERGHRITENAIKVHALTLDIDKNVDGEPLNQIEADEAIARISELGLRSVVHTTHSHAPPLRVAMRGAFALSRAVAAHEWERFWHAAVAYIGIHVEPSCKNADRFWYLPSHPPGVDTSWSRVFDGKPLDVDSIMATIAPRPAIRTASKPTTYTPKSDAFDIDAFIAATYPGVASFTKRGYRCWDIECPWEHEHTPDSGGKHDTIVSVGPDGKLGFCCQHGHCKDIRHWEEFRKWHQPEWVPYDENAPRKTNREEPPNAAADSVDEPELISGGDNSDDDIPPPGDEHAPDEIGARRKRRRQTATAIEAATEHAGIGPKGGYRFTDLGNAARFAAMHGARLRYVQAWRSWLTWDGRRWRKDDIGSEIAGGRQAVAAIYADAAACAQAAAVAVNAGNSFRGMDPEEFVKWAGASAGRSRIENMIALARSEPEIATAANVFDRDPFLLNVRNGTVDLRTGELRPHQQADMITMLADVDYDPKAEAPEWKRFLTDVMPDVEVLNWLQRYLGYALTGDVGEQAFAFWVGKGGNGKNVCADAVVATLGDYAMVGAPDLLLEKKGEAHPTELADIEGRRLAICSEIEPGRAWAESRIKQITGDKTIKARRMKQDFHEFDATAKLVVLANTKPRVKGTDDGTWRRMRLVPWTVQIAKDKQDKKLLGRLIKNELPGILAWLVRGCLSWQKHGLGSAKAIDKATAGYRKDQDVLGLWIADRCLVGDPEMWCATDDLHKNYLTWCEAEGLDHPWTKGTLRARLLDRDGLADRRKTDGRGIAGIRLLQLGEKAQDEGMTE